jgi:hypothetical protein
MKQDFRKYFYCPPSLLWSFGGTAKINCVNFIESLILAQDERWRRALGMQVERLRFNRSSGRRVSNA